MEPQNLAVVAADRIQRFGGNCSPELEWPADTTIAVDEEEDPFLAHQAKSCLFQERKGFPKRASKSKDKGQEKWRRRTSKSKKGFKVQQSDWAPHRVEIADLLLTPGKWMRGRRVFYQMPKCFVEGLGCGF